MTHYAWTIRVHGWHDLQKVTTLADLHDILQILELPGIAPPDWLVMGIWSDEIAWHGRYTHNKGCKDEWTLTWAKVDDAPELMG